MRRVWNVLHNRIWILAAVMLALFFSLQNSRSLFLPALALEQQARCGIPEHVHTEDCYLDDILICREKAHTHSENCYLVLLEDNDINTLLTQVDESADKNLETMIAQVVNDAILYQDGRTADTGQDAAPAELWAAYTSSPSASPSVSPDGWTFFTSGTATPAPTESQVPAPMSVYAATLDGDVRSADISQLNANISGGGIQPRVVLNESLTTMALTPGDTQPVSTLGPNSSVSTLAVGGNPSSTSNNNAYIYVYVVDESGNGEWQYIGTSIKFSVQWLYVGSYFPQRYKSILPNNILTTVNSTVDDALSSTNDYKLYYASSTSGRWSAASTGYSYNGGTTYTAFAKENNTTPFYIRLYQSGSSSATDANALKFCKVTYVNGTNTESFYVTAGTTITAENPGTGYVWDCTDGNTYASGAKITVNKSITLTAKADNYTVSYTHNGSAYYAPTTYATTGTSTHTVKAAPDGYVWIISGDTTKTYDAGKTVTVSGSISFVSAKKVAVTYQYTDGTEDTLELWSGAKTTLPILPDGYLWSDGTSTYADGTSVTITQDTTFTPIQSYQVSYLLPDGSQAYAPVTVAPGGRVTLPAIPSGYDGWADDDGSIYSGGTTVMNITKDTTFTAYKTMTIRYVVNFPTRLTYYPTTTVTMPTVPTMADGTPTSKTVTVPSGSGATILDVSSHKVTAATRQGKGFTLPVAFLGWQLGSTTTTVYPNANPTWEGLESMDATDGTDDDTITLTGIWDHSANNTANFSVCLDITKEIANGTLDTSTGNFTGSLFSTYVGNPNATYNANDYNRENGTDAEQKAVDENIRNLAGYSETNIWFYDFPTDQYIFDKLKTDSQVTGGKLFVDKNGDGKVTNDEVVTVDELSPEAFAIRWYAFKLDGTDGWHIDGKLVRKKGNIVIKKTFEGKDAYVTAAKNGFEITAFNVDASTDRSHTLTLDVATSDYAPTVDGLTYTWTIPNVQHNEEWNITENPGDVSSAGGLLFEEWAILDPTGVQSGYGYNTEVSVNGVTFAVDSNDSEWLRVEFTNVYHTADSLVIRKIDGKTGQPITGAKFTMTSNGTPLTFEKDANGDYRQSSSGVTEVESDGTEIFLNVTYDLGDITITETTPPTGYQLDSTPIVIRQDPTTKAISLVNADAVKDLVTFENGLLVVRNYADEMDVKAQKVWSNLETSQWPDSVTVQLLANGSASTAAAIMPLDDNGKPLYPTTVTLSKQSSGTYSTYLWEGLPVYANGQKIAWSLSELTIGEEEAKTDGSFANWQVTCVTNESTTTDAQGKERRLATVTVYNAPKSGVMVSLTKMNAEKTAYLSGVSFTLTSDAISGFVPRVLTTNEDGLLYFYDLKYDTEYILTETSTPAGYLPMSTAVKFKVSENGTVTITQGKAYASQGDTAFSLLVINRSAQPLPETGGRGPFGFYAAGGALMLLSLCAAILPKLRKRGRYQMRD